MMTFIENQVYKAIKVALGIICLSVTFSERLQASEDEDEDEVPMRYAALECQNDRIFVIVNFYPHKIFKLSWGRDDELIEADLPVSRSVSEGIEFYQGQGVRLRLPIGAGRDSSSIRLGILQASKAQPKAYRNLRCLLHGAD